MDIDYVIAWVDGQDPKHIAARAQFGTKKAVTHNEATSIERYQDNGEIYYHLASILKYAPFVRRVLIVTDNQKPKFLDDFITQDKCDASFIKLVSHDEIFDGLHAARPSFNARAIESSLWRIKDISEHFIYANDDFFINAPVESVAFFNHGKPVLYGNWELPEDAKWKFRFKSFLQKVSPYRYNRPNHGMSQWKGAVLAGVVGPYFNVHHYPHPLRRSTLEAFFKQNPDIMQKQVEFRYRDIAQFNLVALANNLEIRCHGVDVLSVPELAYVDHVKPKHVDGAVGRIVSASAPFGCVQGFEQFTPQVKQHIHRVLIDKFGDYMPSTVLNMLREEAGI